MSEQAAIKAEIARAILEGDADVGAGLAQRALDAGISPVEVFDECVTPTLKDVGDQFGRMEIFLPEMMMSAETVKNVLSVLEPVMKEQSHSITLGTVVIGSAAGDIHDIGREMVATMLEVNGFHVVNLGSDVATQAFFKAARDQKADIIAVSSLLTTSLPYIRDVAEMLKGSGESARFKLLVGGGSVNAEFAAKIGADGYGKDAAEAVQVARDLVGR